MKLTVLFECEVPIDRETERSIGVRGRDADDLDFIITHWKRAYENATGAPPTVILTSPIPDDSISPDDIPVIDSVDCDNDDTETLNERL